MAGLHHIGVRVVSITKLLSHVLDYKAMLIEDADIRIVMIMLCGLKLLLIYSVCLSVSTQ